MKLIIINGPTGVGKSTIAKKIHAEFPLSFLLEIDAQRRYIGEYKKNYKESGKLSLVVSNAIIDGYLQSGHDVIIDKVIVKTSTILDFIEIAKKHNAEIYEFILNSSKATLVKRAAERGYTEGNSLTPEKVEKFWEAIQKYIKDRPNSIEINTDKLDVDTVSKMIMNRINEGGSELASVGGE